LQQQYNNENNMKRVLILFFFLCIATVSIVANDKIRGNVIRAMIDSFLPNYAMQGISAVTMGEISFKHVIFLNNLVISITGLNK